MKSIMQVLKQLTLSLSTWMIIFTMVMFPISASMNQAMAADNESQDAASLDDSSTGEDCSDDKDAKNDDGSTSIYKPGCQFSKDLAKSDLKNHYAEGTKGIV